MYTYMYAFYIHTIREFNYISVQLYSLLMSYHSWWIFFCSSNSNHFSQGIWNSFRGKSSLPVGGKSLNSTGNRKNGRFSPHWAQPEIVIWWFGKKSKNLWNYHLVSLDNKSFLDVFHHSLSQNHSLKTPPNQSLLFPERPLSTKNTTDALIAIQAACFLRQKLLLNRSWRMRLLWPPPWPQVSHDVLPKLDHHQTSAVLGGEILNPFTLL